MPPPTLLTAIAQQGTGQVAFNVWPFPWPFPTDSSQGAAVQDGPIIPQLNRGTSTAHAVPGGCWDRDHLRAGHPVIPTSPNFEQRG